MAFFNPHKTYPERPSTWMEETQIGPYRKIDNRSRAPQNRSHGHQKPPLTRNPTFESFDDEPFRSKKEIVTTKNGAIRKTMRTVEVTRTGPRECFIDNPSDSNSRVSKSMELQLNRKVLILISVVCLVSLLSLALTILLVLGKIEAGCSCSSNAGKAKIFVQCHSLAETTCGRYFLKNISGI